jgi:hypothetical protein
VATFKLYFETMAGTHLTDAVAALRDSCSADALYPAAIREATPDELDWTDVSLARDLAESRRVNHSRRALLFAAFAAEAYANDFLYEHWTGKDQEVLDKLSTPDKYAMLPGFAGVGTVLVRGEHPLQQIKWLFSRRDELVHPKPGGKKDLTWNPEDHNPIAAAESIVAVTEGAEALVGVAPEASVLGYVLAEGKALLEYGHRPLPDLDDESAPDDLLREVRRRDWPGSDSDGTGAA